MDENKKKENTEEPHNKASANKENPLITSEPLTLLFLILHIGNKESIAVRHKIKWSLEMRYCGIPL